MSEDVLNWMGTAATDVGNYALSNVGNLLPMLGTMGASMYSQGQANDAAREAAKYQAYINQRTAQQNQQTWQQNAYPSKATVNAMAAENRGNLGQARLGAYQNLGNTMAARGWGSGSGLGTKAATGIEREYLQGLGKMETELTKFANTPLFAYPSQGYVQPVTAPVTLSPQGAGTNTMATAMGYMQAMNWLRGLNPVNPAQSYSNIPSWNNNILPSYNLSDYGTTDIYSPFYMGGGY